MCIAAMPYGVGAGIASDGTVERSEEAIGIPEDNGWKQFSTTTPAIHTPAKATTDQSIELRISFEPVAPMKIPSHVKAAQPTTGMRTSHGR